MTLVAAMVMAVIAAQNPATIVVESPVLKANQPIPRDYTADGRNMSPPLTWSNLPAGTKDIAVVCEDPDALFEPPAGYAVVAEEPPSPSP